MIDFNKPVQTKDGCKVRILCTDRKGTYPVVGLILHSGGVESLDTWTASGKCLKTEGNEEDLVNVPDKRWIVVAGTAHGEVYLSSSNLFRAWGEAEQYADNQKRRYPNEIFTVHEIEV